MQKIKSFTDLIAWQENHSLFLTTYQITKSFPREEIFSLTSQIRRCVVSISSNIAEGFFRKGKKEKIRFYHMSLGSLTEFQNQLLIARDIEYISREIFLKIAKKIVKVNKLINGLIKSLKK